MGKHDKKHEVELGSASGEGGAPDAKPEPWEKQGAFKRFFSGPYFKVIPSIYERVANRLRPSTGGVEAEDTIDTSDYLTQLKKLVTKPVDQDGVYGLNADELIPLPFDVPKFHAYLVDIASGMYLVAQATIVMFLSINVENRDRTWKSGEKYTKNWMPLIQALIIIYPLFTLVIMMSLTIEYTIRKFMYYRLLSMRILVDWANRKPWQNGFFYYFMATWIGMNVWAIYGVAAYYNKNGNTGVDPVSFGCFVVVNLQTIQLLIYYTRLISSEQRLVALNQIFERAPVEAQRLLTFTYVVEEQDVIDECYRFAVNSEKAFWGRLFNILTCCMGCTGWHDDSAKIKFDIERLKRRAPNYAEVEASARHLMQEMRDAGEATPLKPTPTLPRRKSRGDSDDEEKLSARDSRDVRIAVEGNAIAPEVSPGGQAPPATLPKPMISLCGWSPLRWFYNKFYGSLHCLHVSTMVRFPSWPFRYDVVYFRMFTILQTVGWFVCGAIVVLGWLVATQESTCNKSTKTCNQCLSIHERYQNSAEPVCGQLENIITKLAYSTTGTWNNSGVIEPRYTNFMCNGTFALQP